MNRWRWDQGRLIYFQVDNLKLIAKGLLEIENTFVNIKGVDPLRDTLERYTGLPFSPNNYKLWRNYKRVIECSMLATNIENRLYVTDVCKWLANEVDLDIDDYIIHVVQNFRYPYPAFQDYNPKDQIIYPFCAILKYLITSKSKGKDAFLELDDVFNIIIGNNCTGLEDFDYYKKLKRTNRTPIGDEKRQVREMLMFLSQLSILKIVGKKLYLDVSYNDLVENDFYLKVVNPNFKMAKIIRAEDFIQLTTRNIKTKIPSILIKSRDTTLEDVFTEGKRVRVSHIKIERSPMLRKLYFAQNKKLICNMCDMNTKEKYPWSNNLLEIHHVLPLSSGLALTNKGTSLDDVVPLCPTCHRGVHSYYRSWLNSNKVNDFKDKKEAFAIYEEAKRLVV